MTVSREARKQVVALFRSDLETPVPLEKLLVKSGEHLGKDGFFLELLVEKIRRDRAEDIIKSQEMWFQALGWWFAKLFMWTSLFGAILGVLLFGKASADPLTWAMVGCVVYYVAIQVFTPWRLSLQRKGLEKMSGASRQKALETIEGFEKEP